MSPTCAQNELKTEKVGKPSLPSELYFKRDLSSGTSNERSDGNQIKKLLELFPKLEQSFTIHKKVGFGTFSSVYLATIKSDTTSKNKYAIKHIIPTCHPDRIKFELQCLKNIGGADNVSGINLCLRNKNDVILIMPYQAHDNFCDYIKEMDVHETAAYMKNLLISIARVHKYGIIHRDIKPSNFLYDRKNRRYLLVDFGLAHIINNKQNRNINTGTKRKREASPESEVSGKPTKRTYMTDSLNGTTECVNKTSQKENYPQQHKISVSCNNVVLPIQSSNSQGNLHQKPQNSTEVTKNIFSMNCKKHQDLKANCGCYGKPKTCSKCLVRKNIAAPRAGTPGFRPPEVLLKSTNQDTGVDVWAAGVIMLSILSDTCNFFNSPDDMSALAEIIVIFGLEQVKTVAKNLGRYLICDRKTKPLDIRKICCILRARRKCFTIPEDKTKMCTGCEQMEYLCVCLDKPENPDIPHEYPDSAYDLLKRLLDVNPKTRITAQDALQHPFLKDVL